ncbi:class II fructose-bisphosphate aldolase [Anaerosalibacter massiliensis]|uniref:Class II fructose-bisphosphate aldolase n=1 Tax=Anaerosalibacter massiliensis TaxID=1347392 RepID=A0A9X2MNX6_9FIRM|nr:class II fructose-bisphosphate aldolase [Anaerosalibacter massiliensis]MCR2044496.1 class II fructose-bisphosphate aldolase [Anaerosalibacter massiliensis]
MLVNLNEVLIKAREEKYAVPAFDCTEDILIRTILDTCEEKKSPVILMALERDLKEKGMDYITSMVKGVADKYSIPIVLHLDHATKLDLIERAIDYGFTSVMYDGSMLSFEENIANTRKVVEMAHAKNITVEAELGYVGGNELDGSYTGDTKLTEPSQVLEFVNKTEVDALAVSIGTSHGVYVSEPELNIERLKEINNISPVPLVLHGGSGTPINQVQEAIKNGIAKVNLYADLRIAMFKGLKASAESQKRIDPLPDEMFGPVKEELRKTIINKINMTFSENKGN